MLEKLVKSYLVFAVGNAVETLGELVLVQPERNCQLLEPFPVNYVFFGLFTATVSVKNPFANFTRVLFMIVLLQLPHHPHKLLLSQGLFPIVDLPHERHENKFILCPDLACFVLRVVKPTDNLC